MIKKLTIFPVRPIPMEDSKTRAKYLVTNVKVNRYNSIWFEFMSGYDFGLARENFKNEFVEILRRNMQ